MLGSRTWIAVLLVASVSALSDEKASEDRGWVYNLLVNAIAYAVLVVPAALVVNHYQNNPGLIQGACASHQTHSYG